MQVKFRGKRVDGGGWIEGNLIKHIDSLGELWLIEEYIADYTYKKHQVEPSSIGMFTGVTDKHGKEIYGAIGEKGGDIVIDVSIRKSFEDAGMIDFVYGSFCVKHFHLWDILKLEIIGNAFDNPELLEK